MFQCFFLFLIFVLLEILKSKSGPPNGGLGGEAHVLQWAVTFKKKTLKVSAHAFQVRILAETLSAITLRLPSSGD